jgi:hypothetical protein
LPAFFEIRLDTLFGRSNILELIQNIASTQNTEKLILSWFASATWEREKRQSEATLCSTYDSAIASVQNKIPSRQDSS